MPLTASEACYYVYPMPDRYELAAQRESGGGANRSIFVPRASGKKPARKALTMHLCKFQAAFVRSVQIEQVMCPTRDIRVHTLAAMGLLNDGL